jgi:hypothetical protein
MRGRRPGLRRYLMMVLPLLAGIGLVPLGTANAA